MLVGNKGARARAEDSTGALNLTCSGQVRRSSSYRSCRSPAPIHVPGPSPSGFFRTPLVRPHPAARLSFLFLSPDVRPPRRAGKESGQQPGRRLKENRTLGAGTRSPGLGPAAPGSWSPLPCAEWDRGFPFQPPEGKEAKPDPAFILAHREAAKTPAGSSHRNRTQILRVQEIHLAPTHACWQTKSFQFSRVRLHRLGMGGQEAATSVPERAPGLFPAPGRPLRSLGHQRVPAA